MQLVTLMLALIATVATAGKSVTITPASLDGEVRTTLATITSLTLDTPLNLESVELNVELSPLLEEKIGDVTSIHLCLSI